MKIRYVQNYRAHIHTNISESCKKVYQLLNNQISKYDSLHTELDYEIYLYDRYFFKLLASNTCEDIYNSLIDEHCNTQLFTFDEFLAKTLRTKMSTYSFRELKYDKNNNYTVTLLENGMKPFEVAIVYNDIVIHEEIRIPKTVSTTCDIHHKTLKTCVEWIQYLHQELYNIMYRAIKTYDKKIEGVQREYFVLRSVMNKNNIDLARLRYNNIFEYDAVSLSELFKHQTNTLYNSNKIIVDGSKDDDPFRNQNLLYFRTLKTFFSKCTPRQAEHLCNNYIFNKYINVDEKNASKRLIKQIFDYFEKNNIPYRINKIKLAKDFLTIADFDVRQFEFKIQMPMRVKLALYAYMGRHLFENYDEPEMYKVVIEHAKALVKLYPLDKHAKYEVAKTKSLIVFQRYANQFYMISRYAKNNRVFTKYNMLEKIDDQEILKYSELSKEYQKTINKLQKILYKK
jgi:hypothetical protein